MELELLRWVAAHRVPALDWLAASLSQAGRGGLLWLGLGLLGVAVRRARVEGVWQLALALLLTLAVADGLLKPLVGRVRPYEVEATLAPESARPTGSSFPSGHAATAFAAAVALSRTWRGGRLVWWTLAVLAALSRVYLGVHYPTDVVGGAVLGAALGLFVVGKTSWYSLGSVSRDTSVAR